MSDDDLAFVRTVLAGAGITPPDRELELLARVVPTLRSQLDRAYALDTGDVAPVATFRPGPNPEGTR